MREKHLVYLEDMDGRHLTMKDLPPTIDELRNDPFRSLVWLLKKAGLFEDENAPFQEFEWAKFLREAFVENGWKTEFNSDSEFMVAVNRSLDIVEDDREAAEKLPGAGKMPHKFKHVRKGCERLLTDYSL